MSLENAAQSSLALTLKNGAWKGCALSKQKEQIQIEALFTLPTETLDVPIQLEGKKTTLKELLEERPYFTQLDAETCLVRRVDLPPIKEAQAREVLGFQIEPLLPYPLEEVEFDSLLVEKKEKLHSWRLFLAKKSEIRTHLETLQSLDLDPDGVQFEGLSFARFLAFKCPSPKRRLALFLKEKGGILILSQEEKLLGCHAFSSLEELPKVALALKSKEGGEIASSIPVFGTDSTLPILPSLSETWDLYLEDPQSSFALEIGLALLGVEEKKGIQFRRGEFEAKNPLKRLKKPLLTYALFSLLLASAFFLFSTSYLHYKEANLKKEWSEAVAKLYPKKAGIDADSLSLEQLAYELHLWEEDLKKTPNLFALNPNVPRVSDFLSWLVTHPQVTMDGEKEKLAITSFHYQMHKRPEMQKKQERYQVKIDLEFKTEVPKLAREFHDALIKPNDWIDPKSEIKWTTNRGVYKTSFYLKDRTFYP